MAHDAEEMLQIGKGLGRVLILSSEHINHVGRFHLDCLSSIGGRPRRAEIPLKVCKGRFHGNQIV
jgi:hypothetical protein